MNSPVDLVWGCVINTYQSYASPKLDHDAHYVVGRVPTKNEIVGDVVCRHFKDDWDELRYVPVRAGVATCPDESSGASMDGLATPRVGNLDLYWAPMDELQYQ